MDRALQASPRLNVVSARSLLWLIPAIAAFAVYFQARNHGFIDFDDPAYTFDNPVVSHGLTWSGIAWAFNGSHVANYHPLTWLSHMLDVQLFDMSPGTFALENAVIHAINATLVAALFIRLFGSLYLGVAMGTVFALHPSLVEAVAWISQRKTVLSTAFALITVLLFLKLQSGESSRKVLIQFAALAAYAVSLLAKGMYVTMPAVLLLLDSIAHFTRKPEQPPQVPTINAIINRARSVFPLLIPYVGLSVLISAVTFWAQAQDNAVQSLEAHTLTDRAATAAIGYWAYVRMFFYPTDLSVFYPRPESWGMLRIAAATGALTSITLILSLLRRRLGWSALCGWILFVTMLLPVIGIVQVGEQAYADRYLYGPVLGLLIILASISVKLKHLLKTSWLRIVVLNSASLWLLFVGIISYRQINYWRNSYALAVASEAVVGEQPQLLCIQATILLRAGDFEHAKVLFRRVIELAPNHMVALQNLAVAELSSGNGTEALRLVNQFIELCPNNPAGYTNLAAVLARTGRPTEAPAAISAARARGPLPPAHEELLRRIEREIGDEVTVSY